MRHQRAYLAFNQQKNEVEYCIQEAKQILAEQTKDYIMEHDEVRRVRAHCTQLKEKSKITVPSCIAQVTDLHDLFEALHDYIKWNWTTTDGTGKDTKALRSGVNWSHDEEYEHFFEVGSQIKVRWSKEEMGETGWKPGCYRAEVQEADIRSDEITYTCRSLSQSTHVRLPLYLLKEN